MKRVVLVTTVGAGLLLGALAAHATLPPPPPKSDAEKAAAAQKAAAAKAHAGAALEAAMEKAVANYRQNKEMGKTK